MPAQWTANLLGEMRLVGVTAKQLAAEAGWHEKYLSAVLNGHLEPKNAEKKLREAMMRLEIKKERRDHGLSDDLDSLMDSYHQLCPEYASALAEAIGYHFKSKDEWSSKQENPGGEDMTEHEKRMLNDYGVSKSRELAASIDSLLTGKGLSFEQAEAVLALAKGV